MPRHRRACFYCGGSPDRSAEQNDERLTCPRCAQPMEAVSVEAASGTESGHVVIDECRACGGVWFDRGELEAVAQSQPAEASAARRAAGSRSQLETQRLTDVIVKYLKCPRCQKLMNRQNYGRVSGVLIDVCGYHGAFLDAGEIKAVRDFLDSGGGEFATSLEARDARDRQSTEKLNAQMNRSRLRVRRRRGWGGVFGSLGGLFTD